jgi:hypothetical protein
MSCCGREMILIGTQRVNKGRGKKVLGLAWLNYALDPESKAFKGQGLYDCIEDCWVKKYCLLPLLIDGVDLKVIWQWCMMIGVWVIYISTSICRHYVKSCLSTMYLREHNYKSVNQKLCYGFKGHFSITRYANIVSSSHDSGYSVFKTTDHLENRAYATTSISLSRIIAWINMFL